jgi:PAS domain S-box-containing protein
MTIERDAKGLREASQPPRVDDPSLTAFHMSPSLMAVSTITEGRFLVVNEAFAKKTGYPLADIIGKTSQELNLFANYPDRAATLDRLRAQGTARDVRVDVRTKDGTLLKGFFHAEFIPYQGQHCLLTIFNDMTETLDAMQALAASEEKYRTLAESSPEMIYVIDKQGVVQYVNPAGLAQFKGDEAALIGKHLSDVYPPAIAERHLKAIARVVDTGRPLKSEMLEPFPGGARWIDARLSPIRDVTGVITGVLGMSQDITEGKRAEERFRAIFEQASLGIAMADHALRFTRVNAAFSSMLGWSEQDLAGMTLRDIIDPDDLATEGECLARLGRGEIRQCTTQARCLRKGGGSLWTALSVSAMHDASGDFLQYLVVLEDISAKKRAEEELQRADRIEALKVFAGGIAHDFNNLLSGMLGYFDLARQELPEHHLACEYLDKSFPAFERAKDLARQMLTFAKGGAPVKKPLGLPDLLRNSCHLALSGSNTRCDYRIADGLWPVEGDEHQLAQVWSNLALNAWQAMPGGGTITVSAENRALAAGQVGKLPAGRYVAVAVKDEGVGIPEKIIDKIFDPFFTTKQRGSGLGLATSHSIVTRHGGHIGVSSRPGEGSVFTVFLPASSGPAASPPKTVPDVDLRGSGRVLVMDDERAIREMIRDILSGYGYEVEVAADGSAAVDTYARALREAKGFDLVILDLTVPGGMGGAWALRELKQLDPHVAALVSSGYSDHAELTHFEEHGFAGMVAKPYRASVLLLAVKNAMERKGNAQQGNDGQP